MKKAHTKDGRLARLMKICLALPEAIQESAARHATFLVRKAVFAYYLNDHHGDGIISVCCKVLPGDNEALVAAHPAKFYMPAYIGPRGWVALRLDVSGLEGGGGTGAWRAGAARAQRPRANRTRPGGRRAEKNKNKAPHSPASRI